MDGRLAAHGAHACASLLSASGKVLGPAEPTSETASEMGARRLSNAELATTRCAISSAPTPGRPAGSLISDPVHAVRQRHDHAAAARGARHLARIMSGEVADHLIADVAAATRSPLHAERAGRRDRLRPFIEDWVPRASSGGR
jgi:hypothetical protein